MADLNLSVSSALGGSNQYEINWTYDSGVTGMAGGYFLVGLLNQNDVVSYLTTDPSAYPYNGFTSHGYTFKIPKGFYPKQNQQVFVQPFTSSGASFQSPVTANLAAYPTLDMEISLLTTNPLAIGWSFLNTVTGMTGGNFTNAKIDSEGNIIVLYTDGYPYAGQTNNGYTYPSGNYHNNKLAVYPVDSNGYVYYSNEIYSIPSTL